MLTFYEISFQSNSANNGKESLRYLQLPGLLSRDMS